MDNKRKIQWIKENTEPSDIMSYNGVVTVLGEYLMCYRSSDQIKEYSFDDDPEVYRTWFLDDIIFIIRCHQSEVYKEINKREYNLLTGNG